MIAAARTGDPVLATTAKSLTRWVPGPYRVACRDSATGNHVRCGRSAGLSALGGAYMSEDPCQRQRKRSIRGYRNVLGHHRRNHLLHTHRYSWRYVAQEGSLGNVHHRDLLAILLAHRRADAFTAARLLGEPAPGKASHGGEYDEPALPGPAGGEAAAPPPTLRWNGPPRRASPSR